MANYTFSSKFIEFICQPKKEKYMHNVLTFFCQENPLKISIDKDKHALSIYRNILNREGGSDSKDTVLSLINYMEECDRFERINGCDISNCTCDDEIFLLICSQTQNQKKLIVDSHNSWKNSAYIPGKENIFLFNGAEISIFDKDEALIEIKKTLTQYNNSSFMPTNSSTTPTPPKSNWWKVPSIIVAIIAALSAILVALIQNQTTKSDEKNVCYSITLINKKTNRPATFNNTKAQLTVQRGSVTAPIPITRSSCSYCPNEKLEVKEKVYLTLDNSEYNIIGSDYYLKPDSDNPVYVEKNK